MSGVEATTSPSGVDIEMAPSKETDSLKTDLETSSDTSQHHGMSLTATCLVMIADIVGVGVLSLGSAVALLGWIPGIIILLLMYPINVYTGLYLSETRQAWPTSMTYQELAHNSGGRCFGLFAGVLNYLYIGAMLADYALTAGLTLGMVFYDVEICLPVWSAIAVFGVILPMQQYRSLGALWWVLVINVVSLTLSIFVALGYLWSSGPAPWGAENAKQLYWTNVGETYLVSPSLDFHSFFAALGSFTFAYAGHFLYVEMMSEMKEPEKFPAIFLIQGPYQVGIYLIVACTSFAYLGSGVSGFVINVIPFGPWYRVASFLLFIHVAITFLVKGTVMVRFLHVSFAGKERANEDSTTAKVQWFMLTVLTTVLSYLVANLIPFFDKLSGLIGTLLAPLVCFNLPCIMLVWARRKSGKKVAWYDWVGIASLNVFGVLLVVIGTIAEVEAIVDAMDEVGGPFSCGCISMWNSVSKCCEALAPRGAYGGDPHKCFDTTAMAGAVLDACTANSMYCPANYP